MSDFRTRDMAGYFSLTHIGNAAAVSLDNSHIARSTRPSPTGELPRAETGCLWRECLRPRHFDFEGCTIIRPITTTRADIVCHAVRCTGSGRFQESETSPPVEFHDGGVIVKWRDRCRFLSFETLRKNFVLADGEPIESIYQIDFHVPKL